MQKWRQWQAASQADWSLAVERESIIRPLAAEPRLSNAAVTEAALHLGLSRATLYRLVGRYKQRPHTSSLLPWKNGRGHKVKVLNSEREDLLKSCIKDFYLLPERPSLAALMQEVKRRFAERSLAAPNYRTQDCHSKTRRFEKSP
jgi:putative transposase